MTRPRFEYGQSVRITRDVRNDGTYPGARTGELLARRGSIGHIRDVGVFLQDQLIYSVDFLALGRLVGCRESELIAAEAPWCPTGFQPGEQVRARLALAVGGAIVAEAGAIGEIQARLPGADGAALYEVAFGERWFQIPEEALEALNSPLAELAEIDASNR